MEPSAAKVATNNPLQDIREKEGRSFNNLQLR